LTEIKAYDSITPALEKWRKQAQK